MLDNKPNDKGGLRDTRTSTNVLSLLLSPYFLASILSPGRLSSLETTMNETILFQPSEKSKTGKKNRGIKAHTGLLRGRRRRTRRVNEDKKGKKKGKTGRIRCVRPAGIPRRRLLERSLFKRKGLDFFFPFFFFFYFIFFFFFFILAPLVHLRCLVRVVRESF